jgi:transaldolase
MAGRLDDHLRDVVKGNNLSVPEESITKAGLFVVKKAYKLFSERCYESNILVGGMRGTYHVTELVGGKLILTISPSIQDQLKNIDFQERINIMPDEEHFEKLLTLDDFKKSYNEDGMIEDDFEKFGPNVKTQNEFIKAFNEVINLIENVRRGRDDN